MKAEVTKYRGRQVLSLPTDKAYHFCFGQAKAKLILQYIDDIYEFAGIPKPNGSKPRVVKKTESGCWYCHNGHELIRGQDKFHPYLLCGCGASIVDMVGKNRKFKRNKLGGIMVTWGH